MQYSSVSSADRLDAVSLMLSTALVFLSLGLVVFGLNWLEIVTVSIPIYWLFSLGGMGLLIVYLGIRRPKRTF